MQSHPDQSPGEGPEPARTPGFSWRALIALGVSLVVVVAGGSLALSSRTPAAAPQAALAAASGSASASSSTSTSPSPSPTGPPQPTAPWLPTTVRVSTFNVLGYSHTDPSRSGYRKGWLDGRTRQSRANQIIRANNLQIIGFQEMQVPQIEVFKREMGASFDLWPGGSFTGRNKGNVNDNSIAWRKDLWTAISRTYYDAPYFSGRNVVKPIVLLQNRATGQQVYVTNTHNPANTEGNAQKYRDQSVDIQASTFNALRAQHPTTPIIFTGDMNDRSTFYCRFTAKTSMRAVNGGTRTAKSCALPRSPQIDWIMTTPDVQWTGYQSVRTPYVKATTDHPVIWADATITAPAVQRSGIRRVVVLDVEGLPSAAISGARAAYAPRIAALRATGVSTLNARTTAENVGALPNLVTTLSGRPVSTSLGGHNVSFAKDKPRLTSYRTLKSKTGAYVNTLFDTVHDQGGSTSFMSTDPNAAIVIRSARAGLADTQGVDHGRNKLTVASIRAKDSEAITVLRQQLSSNPRTVSYVQLSNPRVVGETHGFFGTKYLNAVRQADARVGRIVALIRSIPRLADSTAIVLTSSSGGSGRSTTGTAVTNYQVPLAVWGHGITVGDLYRLNPTFQDPGTTRPGYGGAQPLRNANVANIVTTLIGHPALPTPTTFGRAIRLFH